MVVVIITNFCFMIKKVTLASNKHSAISHQKHLCVCALALKELKRNENVISTLCIYCLQGYDCKKKFIAAQGPKENTLDDFWRMIWEQRCFVVVMITQLHEMGRVSSLKSTKPYIYKLMKLVCLHWLKTTTIKSF